MLSKIRPKEVPFKISFFMWRLLKNKLPLDGNTQRFGIHTVSRCSCCSRPKEESRHHLFVEGDTASVVWHNISRPLGVNWRRNNITNVLYQWWKIPPKTQCLNLSFTQLPLSLVGKFGKLDAPKSTAKKNTTIARICQQIVFLIETSMCIKFSRIENEWNWNQTCYIAGSYKPRLKSIMVTWVKP